MIMHTIAKTSPALSRRPSTGIIKTGAKDRAALVAAHRELEAVDQRLLTLSKLKNLRRELESVPALFAAGKISTGDAIRSAPAALDVNALHSIRGSLTTACKARGKELLAEVAPIVLGIERQALADLEAKAETIAEGERATARELDVEFVASTALAALDETVRREAQQIEFMAERGINRQALARAMAAAGIEPQPAALADDGETDHAEMLADLK
jgi:hypothetical protein